MNAARPGGNGSAPLRVLFVTPNLGLAGGQKCVVELVKGLDRARFEPVVCCLHDLEGGHYEPLIRELGVETVLLRPGSLRDLRFPLRIRALLRDRRIDLVNTHQHLFDFWISLACRLSGVPCVVTKQNVYPHRGLEKAAVTAMEWVTGRAAASHVAVSAGVRRHMEEHLRVPSRDVEVIHNSLDTAGYAADRSVREAVRAELGIEPETPVAGTVANLFPRKKGYEVLVETIPAVRERIPDVLFLVVGRDVDGLRGRLEARAAELGVRENLRFLGARPDVPRVLNAFDLFVSPSLREGLPYVLLEAMSTSLPVVATAVGGSPELVDDGRTGLLVPPGDPARLADAVLTVLAAPERAAAMGRAGRDRVIASFSAHQMVAKYQRIFEGLVPRAGAAKAAA